MIEIRLNNLLKKTGKNASEIAVETGINRNTINSLVNQKIDGIRFSTLEKLCQTYDLKITDIIDFKQSEQTLAPRKRMYRQEAEMVPFTIWPGMIALSQISISDGGRTQYFGRMDAYFHMHYTVSYWDYDTMNEFAKIFYAKYKAQAEIERYFSEYLVLALEIENLYEALWGQDPVEMSELDFKNIAAQTEQAYVDFWLKSFIIETFDAGYDQEQINKISKRYNLSKEEIEVLTTPEKLTSDDERKLAFLSLIAKWVGKKESLSGLIEKDRDKVEEYKRKFDSYRSNYAEVFHIADEEIISESEDYLSDAKGLKKEIKRLTAWEEERKKAIEVITKKHHLRSNPLYYFNKLTYFREHRKTVNLKGFHVLDFILSCIEARTGIAKKYLKFLSFEEIVGVLRGLVSADSLRHRFNQGILVSINYGKPNEIKVFDSLEAKSISQDLDREYLKKGSESSLIKGITASQGYAEGVARIILSQEDFSSFKEDEILVTSMTRSHFLPLMEKAKAIVTSEGGLSCHAAVVSRNLGKPCVIGTKIATNVIKNGDRIEVRASDGTVRILN
jgi:phosphohistidine swiveling domain-containing protein/DNA-binding Xre family transcriptional regulator